MKVQGLNKDDFDRIDRALCFFINTQLQKAKECAWNGDAEVCESFMDAARETIETYKKLQAAERGYKIKRWVNKEDK